MLNELFRGMSDGERAAWRTHVIAATLAFGVISASLAVGFACAWAMQAIVGPPLGR